MNTDPRTVEALDRELADHAAQAERAIAAEQSRSADLTQQLEAAAAWNRQLRAQLNDAQVELRFLHRLPIDLPRFFERRGVRFAVRLAKAIRGRRGSAT